jgi:Flp pilus assembly protein TadD
MSTHDSRGYFGIRGTNRGRRLALGATVVGMALTFAVVGCTNSKTSTTGGAGATTASATETAGGTPPVTGLQKPSSTPSSDAVVVSPPSSTNTSVIQAVPVGGKTQAEYESDLVGLQDKAKASPSDLTVLQDLAIAQYQTQRYDEAIATYQQMIKIKNEPVYHNNLGNVLRDAGREADATKEYQAAIAADPTLVVAYVNLGSLQFSQDDVAGGSKTLEEGIAKTTGEDQQRLKDVKAALLKPKTTVTT